MKTEKPAAAAHFRALVRATSDVVYRMSSDWTQMQELEGSGFVANTNEPLTTWMERYVHADDRKGLKEAIAFAIANQSIFEFEHRVFQTDHTIGWVYSKAIPILDDNGKVVEWFGAAANITERKKIEEELYRQRKLYEAVTTGTPDLVYVFELDYTFSYANPALLEMWGKSAENAIGKRLIENGYEPWHAEMHEREIDHIVKTGERVRGEVSFPHAVLGKRVYDYILTPVFGAEGKVVAVSGITRDVTEYRKQEERKLEMNEEMAAINAELGASNEELTATNEELQLSQDMLGQVSNNLELILNMLPASVVVIRGEDLVVEMINQSNLEYWKRTKDEVVGRSFLEILPDLANQPFAGQLRHVMATGEVIDVKESPVLFTMPDGSIRETYVDYTYQPLSDLKGNRNGVLVMSFEITDRVRSKQLLEKYVTELADLNHQMKVSNDELFKSEQRFKYLIMEAPVAIGILNGRELIIESANAKLLEVWGKTAQVIGKTLANALPELQGQPFLTILDEVYTAGTPFFANEISAMLEHEGQLRELFFNVVYQPVKNIAGTTADILIVATDVTAQVLARRQVEQSEQHFRKLADLVPAKISNALPSGEVTFFNRHWLDFAGMSFEDMRDFGYHQMMHPDEIDNFQLGLAKAAAKGEPYISEMRFKNTSGEYIWHLNIASPILDENGQITMWVGSTTDIQTLKDEEQRKSDFVSMLSHELKTPVTSIKGHVQLSLRQLNRESGSELANKLIPSLARIDVLLGHLTGLIGNMLDLSRIDAGRLDLNLEEFAMDKLITEVVEDFRLSHQQHYFHLQTENRVMVQADRNRISQVVINLISNAIKYSPKSNTVDISVSANEKEVMVSIRDYGIGIDEKDKIKVFERFYRVEGKNEKYYSGFGIGLFLAHSIVERHGGQISLESEKDKGSTFIVRLPNLIV